MPTWHWTRFTGLSADDVYDMLALRSRIFVVEQACVYLDPDGLDRQSWHLLGREDGRLTACLRVVDPTTGTGMPSVGRVVVDPSRRGSGLGHVLVAEGLRRCDLEWPGRANHISAQAHLQRFYERHGYVVAGEAYLEDGIPHLPMDRAPTH